MFYAHMRLLTSRIMTWGTRLFSDEMHQVFGVAQLRDEVRRLNRHHFWRLRLAARTCDSVARRHATLLNTEEPVITTLLDQCPTLMFAVTPHAQAPEQIWAASDDLLDHLVTARDVARHSPEAAAYVFAVPESLLAALQHSNMQAVRALAACVHLDVRWSRRDLQAASAFVRTALRHKQPRRTYCLDDTPLVLSCLAMRQLKPPPHLEHGAGRARRPACVAAVPSPTGEAT